VSEGASSSALVVTAEHGGNRVPRPYRDLFRDAGPLLGSHRGWDPGSLDLARRIAHRLDAPLVSSTVTRLLVDLNRSAHNPRVFSEITRELDQVDRKELLRRWHRPHRDAAERAVADALAGADRVVHLAIHTFTPELGGVVRRPDIALLYDPRRGGERGLAARWARLLRARARDRVVARNDPYRGAADGLTTALRRVHPDPAYVGIEIEVNQRHLGTGGRFPGWVADALTGTLPSALEGDPATESPAATQPTRA
jgi:predicted N-formylglutamate amidohydrolase